MATSAKGRTANVRHWAEGMDLNDSLQRPNLLQIAGPHLVL